jgi:deazaflavin-dependent oxidoreductase (nitroreductase family)
MRASRILQRAVRFFNPLTRLVLQTPLHPLMSGRVMLLSFTGRKTGRSYTTPVSYVREGNSLLVPGGGAWWRNLEAGPPVRVHVRGVWRGVTSKVIKEPTVLADTMQRMLAENPAVGVFTGIKAGPDGRPDGAALERERQRGFVVVQLCLGDNGRQAQSVATSKGSVFENLSRDTVDLPT